MSAAPAPLEHARTPRARVLMAFEEICVACKLSAAELMKPRLQRRKFKHRFAAIGDVALRFPKMSAFTISRILLCDAQIVTDALLARRRPDKRQSYVLSDRLSSDARIEKLIELTARHHGVEAGEIIGHRRIHHVHAARIQAVVTVRHYFPALSLPKLGDIFNRDHSTILHELRAGQKRGVQPLAVTFE